jgi:hypothetical protein
MDVPSAITSPKRIRSPLTFSRHADRRDAAVTSATSFLLVASTSHGDVVFVASCVEVVAQQDTELDGFGIDKEDQRRLHTFDTGPKDSVAEKNPAVAINAVDAINLIATIFLCSSLCQCCCTTAQTAEEVLTQQSAVGESTTSEPKK